MNRRRLWASLPAEDAPCAAVQAPSTTCLIIKRKVIFDQNCNLLMFSTARVSATDWEQQQQQQQRKEKKKEKESNQRGRRISHLTAARLDRKWKIRFSSSFLFSSKEAVSPKWETASGPISDRHDDLTLGRIDVRVAEMKNVLVLAGRTASKKKEMANNLRFQ